VYPSWTLPDGVAQHPGVHPPCVAPFATLRYRVTGDPLYLVACHCKECQR
jgi:hypothetical protein